VKLIDVVLANRNNPAWIALWPGGKTRKVILQQIYLWFRDAIASPIFLALWAIVTGNTTIS
jgi:hypothetical protein